MNDETMFLLKVGRSSSDAVRVPGIYRTAEGAEQAYKKFYESAFSYYSIAEETVY